MKLKHWIRIIAFCAVCGLLVYFTGQFLQIVSPRTAVRVHGMYKEPENSIDVALFGASDVYTSFYSPLAYELYGFTSYPVCSEGTTGQLYTSMVREIRKTQNPDLYVFEIWAFNYSNQYDEVALRRWIDSIEPSENRNQTIDELVPEDLKESFKHPFLKYHSNWYNIGNCIQAFRDKLNIDRRGFSITKGYSTITEVYTGDPKKLNSGFSKQGLEALKKLLEFCKEEGLENVLFMRLPSYDNFTTVDSFQKGKDMIAEYGYDFLDIYELREEVGIENSTDFYNETHMNCRGTQKVTKYLGNYINENYNLGKGYSDEVKEEWDYCASFNKQIFDICESNIKNGINVQLWMHKDFKLPK